MVILHFLATEKQSQADFVMRSEEAADYITLFFSFSHLALSLSLSASPHLSLLTRCEAEAVVRENHTLRSEHHPPPYSCLTSVTQAACG